MARPHGARRRALSLAACAAKVDAAAAEAGWDTFKADVSSSFDTLEHDVAAAFE